MAYVLSTPTTNEEITNTYAAMKTATEAVHAAMRGVTKAVRTFKIAKADRIRMGVEGKNAPERDANLEQYLINESDAVNDAEDVLADAKLTQELAAQDLASLRMIVRNAEVGAAISELNEL